MELLSVREQHAHTLLIHYRWDVEKLTAIFVDRDRDYLFSQAGVPLDQSQDVGSLVSSSNVMCTVCWEDVPGREATKMDCGHSFCNDCESYFLYEFYLLTSKTTQSSWLASFNTFFF